MKLHGDEVLAGDKVFTTTSGWGTVQAVDSNRNAIVVTFSPSRLKRRVYKGNGVEITNARNPGMLFWHDVRTFKLPKDPEKVEQLRALVTFLSDMLN